MVYNIWFFFWLMFGGPPEDCRPLPDGTGVVCRIGETTANTPRELLNRPPRMR